MSLEIGFYHLTRTSLSVALAKLLGRVLALPARALVLCPDAAVLATLDRELWLSNDPDWLPHGTPATGDADLQPIWLTTEPPGADGAPNGARHLFLAAGASLADPRGFERVFDLFDGTDQQAVADARRRWSAAKAAGLTPVYWRQGPRGWERGEEGTSRRT